MIEPKTFRLKNPMKKLTNIFNECLINEKFPDTLKRAEVTPIVKKGNDNEKENYLPVSMLSNFSKVFENLLFEQINDHMQSKFSKHLTGFRKNHSTQNALLVMIGKWKTILNKKLKVGTLFMGLIKAFNTLDHSLLLAKLSACGFDNNSLSFVRSYLTNNFLVLNSNKCHFMTLGAPNTLPSFKCKNIRIKNSASENLLGIIIDNKLDFTERLNTVCKKANLKLHALNRISRFLSIDQHVIIINAYIRSLFNYCPLV